MPTLLDAALPFAFLASELFPAHFISRDPRGYLLADAILALVALSQYAHTFNQVRLMPADNRAMLRMLTRRTKLRVGLLAVITAAAIVTWALYGILGLERMRLVVAVVILALNVLYLLDTVPYWNHVLGYARRGQGEPAMTGRER